MEKANISVKTEKKLKRVKELATYCFSCGKCQIVCPTSILGIFSPKGFIHRYITEGDVDIDSFVKKEKLFNCLTCEQCAIYCPMATEKEGVIFAEIMQGIREYAFSKGLLNSELSLIGTHDELMQKFPMQQANSDSIVNKIDFIKNDPALKINEKGDIAYFMGCSSQMESIFYQFDIKYKDTPRAVISILNDAGITPVVLETKCCGHDSYWSGDVETAKKLAKFNVDLYHKAGVKTIIVECAEGYRMWKYDYPELVENCNFEIKHFSEFIVEKEINKTFNQQLPLKIKVTYHDPCRLGRLGGHIYDSPRTILKSIPNVELIEMKNIKKDANCCGVPTFRGCTVDTKRIRENRINEALETGAEYLVTTCPKCITHFSCFINEVDNDGKEKSDRLKLKVIDLASFIAKAIQKL